MSNTLLELHNPSVCRRVTKLADHLNKQRDNGTISPIMPIRKLLALLNREDAKIVEDILDADPTDFNKKTPPLGIEEVPEEIVAITTQHDPHNVTGGSTKYLPREVYEKFIAMQVSFRRDHPGRELLLDSGYRSQAYQVVVLLNSLTQLHDFDLEETLKWIALPTCSQHCSATATAIDIINIDGQPSDDAPDTFPSTVEYAWLSEHASTFSFYESYPPDNPDGIGWEPWHWQYRV